MYYTSALVTSSVATAFRADQIGSFLRPPELLAARKAHETGSLSAAELEQAEDAAIGEWSFDEESQPYEVFERAAEFFNVCHSRGVQGSNTDFVICAIADRYGMAILATDGDFPLYAPHLPIQLHVPRP